jgi:diguanylate cyclase (GGDEF)-like protein
MDIDLFESEQKVSDNAAGLIQSSKGGDKINLDDYIALAGEYDKLLEQFRRATRMSDKTESALFASTLDLTDKVHHDALTGIFNRRYMEDALKRIITTLARSGGGDLSVLMMDLDFFKYYNDAYGHNMGDACLTAVAKTIESSIHRQGDFAVRYGGEEVVVILPNTDEGGACEVASRILKNVKSLGIPHEKSEVSDHVTISIGITSGNALHTKDGLDFIRRADDALYTSKHSGRNRYTYKEFRKG